MNALGQPRSWTDHLLWHHAAHTVDLFQYQTGEPVVQANAIQGPIHPSSASRWTCRSSSRSASGAICTLSLSFNNDGPLGTFFRYICDNGTYIARYDDLVTGKDEKIDVSKVDVSMNGIELQDREFSGHPRGTGPTPTRPGGRPSPARGPAPGPAPGAGAGRRGKPRGRTTTETAGL